MKKTRGTNKDTGDSGAIAPGELSRNNGARHRRQVKTNLPFSRKATKIRWACTGMRSSDGRSNLKNKSLSLVWVLGLYNIVGNKDIAWYTRKKITSTNDERWWSANYVTCISHETVRVEIKALLRLCHEQYWYETPRHQ